MIHDLAEVITKAIDYRLATMHVCMPATVIAYNAATQTVNVQPVVASAIPLETGTLVEPLPMIADVPVEFPRGGGYVVVFPLNPGDTGIIECTDFSIDLWRQAGIAGTPNDLSTHALGNAVFRPGLSPSTKPIVGAPAAGMMVGAEAGKQIVISATGVFIGSSMATKGVARQGDSVQVTIPINSFLVAAQAGVMNSVPVAVSGTITSASTSVKADD